MARKRKVAEPDYVDKLVNRIDECDTIVRELDNSKIWQIIQRDMQEERQRLDDNWQELIDEQKLYAARVLKMATMHILELKKKYSEELEGLQKELSKHQNKDNEFIKDTDTSPLEEKIMDSDFNDALVQTLNFEGGIDPTMAQQGVVSNRGITQELYNAYNKKVGKEMKNVKDISYGDVKDIGMEEFWKPMKLDQVPSSSVRAILFDDGFNAGGGTAIKSLQRIVGSKADGLVGKNTIKALNKYLDKNGETALINSLLSDREQRYFNLATEKPQVHQKHLNGWINRVNSLRAKYIQ